MRRTLAAALLATLAATPAAAWTVEEHRLLADSALARATAVLDSADRARLSGALRAPWGDGDDEAPTFGSVCAAAATDDYARGRYHVRGRSVLEQIAELAAAEINMFVDRVSRGDEDILRGDRGRFQGRLKKLERSNVVENYLVHHLAAMRIAANIRGERLSRAGIADSVLRCALLHEAIAQSYLADAFAAGHMMPAPGGRLGALHPINRGRLHDHYGKQGLYVLNARGEVWQTFGDRLLLWYGPSYDHVFEACVQSLHEVLLAHYGFRWDAAGRPTLARRSWSASAEPGESFFFPPALAVERRGSKWLDQRLDRRLEGLMRIPTPVTATWSMRTDSLDAHGLAVRRHYPQFADSGWHDPSLSEEERKHLPAPSEYPDWMIPRAVRGDPTTLIRDDPDWASVRFIQPQDPTPSYTGLVTMGGYHRIDDATGGGGHWTYGLGYSPAGENAVLFQRLSVDALLLEPGGDGGPRAWALALAFNVQLPDLGIWREPWIRWVEGVRWSVGHAFDRGEANDSDGARYTVGLESPAFPLRVTNAAVTLRVEGEWMRLDRPHRGLGVMLVLQ